MDAQTQSTETPAEPKMTVEERAARNFKVVKNYAKENYDKEGWNLVVDHMTDNDILEFVKDCRKEKSAIDRMRFILKLIIKCAKKLVESSSAAKA